jgi:hypothetical protein
MTDRRFVVVGLVGALANLAYATHRLPAWPECFHFSRTPLDHSAVHGDSPDYSLLADAQEVIPAGARVLVRTASENRARDAVLFRFAVALLPGRRIVAATPGTSAGVVPAEAEYVVLHGAGGRVPDAELLRSDERGSIWKARAR